MVSLYRTDPPPKLSWTTSWLARRGKEKPDHHHTSAKQQVADHLQALQRRGWEAHIHTVLPNRERYQVAHPSPQQLCESTWRDKGVDYGLIPGRQESTQSSASPDLLQDDGVL